MNCCIGDGKVSNDDLYTAIAMAHRGNVQIQEMTINEEAYDEIKANAPGAGGHTRLTFMASYGSITLHKGAPIKKVPGTLTLEHVLAAWSKAMTEDAQPLSTCTPRLHLFLKALGFKI